jgi:hypothetical protein
MWRWGPESAHRISLVDIDSAATSIRHSSLMELVCDREATKECTAILLDDFMNGFLFKLFQQKWEQFAKTWHWRFIGVDAAIVLVLMNLGFWLKTYPTDADRFFHPLIALGLLAIQLIFEVDYVLYIVDANGDGDVSIQEFFALEFAFLYEIFVPLFAMVACAYVMFSVHTPADDGLGDEYAWCLLALAIFTQSSRMISKLFVPNQVTSSSSPPSPQLVQKP